MKKRMSLQDKAEAAMKKAVRQVVENHKKQAGRWQCGKTVRLCAFPLTLPIRHKAAIAGA